VKEKLSPPWAQRREDSQKLRKMADKLEAERKAAEKKRESEEAREEYEDRKALVQGLIEVIDDEIYEHDRELTWGPVDKRKMREVVLRQMVKNALVGMNRDHFRNCEVDEEDDDED
jgi:hypothetical protein